MKLIANQFLEILIGDRIVEKFAKVSHFCLHVDVQNSFFKCFDLAFANIAVGHSLVTHVMRLELIPIYENKVRNAGTCHIQNKSNRAACAEDDKRLACKHICWEEFLVSFVEFILRERVLLRQRLLIRTIPVCIKIDSRKFKAGVFLVNPSKFKITARICKVVTIGKEFCLFAFKRSVHLHDQ